MIEISNLLNRFVLSYEAGWQNVDGVEWEADFVYQRYINRFTSVYAGVYGEGNDDGVETERLIGGVNYLLPGNVWASAWVDSDGGARVSLDRELMLTPRLGVFGEVEYDTHEDWSFQAGASYLITPNLSATGLWDSVYGWGAGVSVRF